MKYTLSIPVYPFVKSYLITRYGEEPIRITRTQKIGRLLCMCLERNPRMIEPGTKYPQLGDSISFEIGEQSFKEVGIYIPVQKVHFLNQVIQDEILDEVFLYLNNLMDNVGQKKQDHIYILNKQKKAPAKYLRIPNMDLFEVVEVNETIRDILNKYNIDGNKMTFDSVKKAYQRRLKAS